MLPTPEEFVQLTSLTGAKNKRGSTLLGVDHALDNWRDKMTGTLDAQIQALYAIIKECGRYLHRHAKKTGYIGQGAKGEWLQQTRKVRVQELLDQAQAELKRLAPGIGRGFDIVQERKRRHLEEIKRKQNRFQTKSLSSGYDRERTQWTSHDKQVMPFAGSFVHMVQGSPKNFVPQEFTLTREGQKILNTDFSKLSLHQYEMLGQQGGGGQVTYYNKIARMQFLAVPDGNGGFTDTSDRPINMDTYNKNWADLHMYALDHHGNLFTRFAAPPEQQSSKYYVDHQYFNHSSFNAGREVICAGMIWIRGGKLRHLDNNSGHYKPGWNNILEALEFFHHEGIDLGDARVMDFTPASQHYMKEYQALSVLDKSFQPFSHQQELDGGLARA
jgi:hypothetical protein